MTTKTSSFVERYSKLIAEHQTWLNQNTPKLLPSWDAILKAQPESAIAEAWVRQNIIAPAHTAEPNDLPKKGGIDFRYMPVNQTGTTFYIEVTNLESDSLGKNSKLPDRIEDWEGGGVAFTQGVFRRKRESKQKQLTDAKGPALIAITAFHETATFVHFERHTIQEILIPPCNLHWDDQEQSRKEYIFKDNLFFKGGNRGAPYEPACPKVSGVLLCNTQWTNTFTRQPLIWLVLNPTATHPFNPEWLPGVPCCKLQDNWQTVDPCRWSAQWIHDSLGTETS